MVWSDPAEAKQAVDLLPAWVDIDVDDALELLGSSFENREVRSYAVTQLRSANDDVSESATCTMQGLLQRYELLSHTVLFNMRIGSTAVPSAACARSKV